MSNHLEFFREFYGENFLKNYMSVWDGRIDHPSSKFHKIQHIVDNPLDLASLVLSNKNKPFSQFIHANTYLDLKDKHSIILNKWFIDWDVSNPIAKSLKDRLVYIRRFDYANEPILQYKLMQRFRDLIINGKIAEPAINEAKDFADKFEQEYGKPPILFFSGAKGAHSYCFFPEIVLKQPDITFLEVAQMAVENMEYKTLDLAVHKDVTARKSRIPYTKHPFTGLTVVPFNIEDSYEEIMSKSLNPQIEEFNRSEYTSDFHKNLQEYDESVNERKVLEEVERRRTERLKLKKMKKLRGLGIKSYGKSKWVTDHRDFFRKELGYPSKEYDGYDMYHCPFAGHADDNPSFMVYQSGFKCLGCGIKGNYFTYLQESNGWSEKEIYRYMKSKY